MTVRSFPQAVNLLTEAEAAAATLRTGRSHVSCLEPGNGSRYVIVLTPFTGCGGDPQHTTVSPQTLVSLPDWKTCYPMTIPGYCTATYAAEKLFGGNHNDGDVVATFLNAVSDATRTI